MTLDFYSPGEIISFRLEGYFLAEVRSDFGFHSLLEL